MPKNEEGFDLHQFDIWMENPVCVLGRTEVYKLSF